MKKAGRKLLYLRKSKFDLNQNKTFWIKKKQAKSSYISANSPQRNSI